MDVLVLEVGWFWFYYFQKLTVFTSIIFMFEV